MAATDHGGRRLSSALQALTASALLLPGVQSALAQDTTGDSANVQFSSFSEGRRNTALDTRADPLHAYTVELNATKILPDGNALHVGLLQDSWSGATPVTVAPAAFGGNRPVLVNAGSGTAVAGASPVVNGSLLLDRTLRPVQGGGDELVLSSASPEVRKQVELGYDINAPTRHHAVDAGYSTEPDFRSWHADWHSRFDFNRQQTTLAIGAGYVHSDIDARLDPALLPYLSLDPDSPSYHRNGANVTMQGVRTDRNLSLGLTQVLNHDAVIDISASVEASDGLLSNPYKAMTVLFVPPEALAAGAGTFSADVRALPEQRPDERRQQSVDVRYVQYFGATDAALHVDAGYSHDDWGIASGSIELQWVQPLGNWQLSPRVRWYSQTAADFHAPYLVTPQHFRAIARDSQGRELWHDTANANLQYVRTADGTLLDAAGNVLDPALVSATPDFVNFSRALLPRYFSSDARLGAYGVVSGGLGLQYRFGNGLRLDAGIDYYRRASSLQFDGEGDTPYADYHYVSASLALSYDWQQASATHHHHHDAESGTTNDELLPPAAVQFVHDAMPAGSVMAGYQLMMDNPDMTMHMLDLHYAVDDRWSLMLMPQFMTMRHVHDAAAAAASVHAHHGSGSHLIGMPQLLAASNWSWPAGTEGHWQLTAGMGVPVTGSDAWSAQPALAYWRQRGDWQWGAQLRSQDDLQQRQADSHEPAHATEQNLWLSTTLVGSLAATLHAMHDDRRYVDVGTYHTYSLGVGVGMPLLGNPLRLEWLQPVSAHDPTDPRPGGGSLVLQWQLALH